MVKSKWRSMVVVPRPETLIVAEAVWGRANILRHAVCAELKGYSRVPQS